MMAGFVRFANRRGIDFEIIRIDHPPAHQLVDIFNELDNTVLANWKAPIINDFMAMIFYGVLDALM